MTAARAAIPAKNDHRAVTTDVTVIGRCLATSAYPSPLWWREHRNRGDSRPLAPGA
jgi:hypothetical protein